MYAHTHSERRHFNENFKIKLSQRNCGKIATITRENTQLMLYTNCNYDAELFTSKCIRIH